MAAKAHAAVVAIFGAFLAATGNARGASSATPADGPQPCAQPKRPGEDTVPTESQDFEDKYLLGDWLGARPLLARRGIRLTLLFITDPFGNVTGGLRRGFSDYNLVGADLLLDTDKLLGWCGGELHIGFADNFGVSLSENYVGNGFPVQLADVADTHVRLTYLSYTQSLFDDELSLRVGRLTINSVYGDEFLASEYFKAFTSVGIDLIPLGLFLNAPGAFGYPDTTWGARIKVEPVEQLYAMVGAYNGDPSLKEGVRHGVDFSLRGPLFLIGEIGLRNNYGKDADGLAGNLKVGGYYDGGRYGLYLVGDEELWRWGTSTDNRHLGAFGALTFTPDRQASVLPFFFDAGLVLYGPTARRPKDFAGFAVVYGSYGASAPAMGTPAFASVSTGVPDFEMTLEWMYGLKLLPGLLLEPDVQYILRPSGERAIPNALAVGLNVVVAL